MTIQAVRPDVRPRTMIASIHVDPLTSSRLMTYMTGISLFIDMISSVIGSLFYISTNQIIVSGNLGFRNTKDPEIKCFVVAPWEPQGWSSISFLFVTGYDRSTVTPMHYPLKKRQKKILFLSFYYDKFI